MDLQVHSALRALAKLFGENPFKGFNKFGALLCRQFVEIELPPFDSGQFRRSRNVEEHPIGFASLEGHEESSMGIRHLAHDLCDKSFAGRNQFVARDRLLRHPLEAAEEFSRDVLAGRGENFRHRAIVAEQVDDECLAQGSVDPFVGKQIPHVE